MIWDIVHGEMSMLCKQSLTHTCTCRLTHVDTLCKIYARLENSNVSGISMVKWQQQRKFYNKTINFAVFVKCKMCISNVHFLFYAQTQKECAHYFILNCLY